MSEPDAGSDVSSLKTRAVYDEAKDEWVLNGTKAWATNGGIADVHVVTATVDPDARLPWPGQLRHPRGHRRPRRRARSTRSTASRPSHTAEVVLDDCRVPGSMLLGGKEKLDAKLAKAREGTEDRREAAGDGHLRGHPPRRRRRWPSASPGPPTRIALDYAKERQAFGKPIIENQAIAFMLADMITEIDASRLLVWRAAWLARNGGYTNAEGSQSKLKAGRTAVWVTERAIQILGGYGYTREYPVERMHRDAKIYDIFEGTEQIQQGIIARAISEGRIDPLR